MKILKRIVVFFLSISFILLIWAVWNYYSPPSRNRTNYTNIKIPIEFTAGKIYSKQFKIQEDEKYEISIRFYRLIPDNTLDSLIGSSHNVFLSNKSILPISFNLSINDSAIVSLDTLNTYSFSSTPNYKARYIDVFNGIRDNNYKLELKINKTIYELNNTNPELVISVVPIVYKRQIGQTLIREILAEKIMIYSFIIFGVFLIIYIIITISIKRTA